MRNCYENIPSNQIEPYGFIYLTTNLVNGKKYIGQRKITHTALDDQYLGSGKALRRAINKYGKENFCRTILCWAWDYDDLNNKEIEYIALYNAVEDPNFYNIMSGGKVGITEDVIKQRNESIRQWYVKNPEKAAEKCAKHSRHLYEENKRWREEHPDEVELAYKKSSESLKEYYATHPNEVRERNDKLDRLNKSKSLYPIVCVERNEVYVAIWHAKTLVGNKAYNIKKHIAGDSTYTFVGIDSNTNEELHWRFATLKDFDTLSVAEGGEAYEQLCREFLSSSDRQAV